MTIVAVLPRLGRSTLVREEWVTTIIEDSLIAIVRPAGEPVLVRPLKDWRA